MFITYMHPIVGSGRASLAIRFNPMTKLTEVGVAFASPKDQFCRAKGRMIAENRLVRGSDLSFEFYADDDLPLKEQVYEQFMEFTYDFGPRWATR